MKKCYLFILSISIALLNSYGQSDIEKEIISGLLVEEFTPVINEPSLNENEKNLDQEDYCLIIISETYKQETDLRSGPTGNFLKSELTNLDSCMLNDFAEKNQYSVKIPELCLDRIKLIYIAKEKWNEIMKEGGWPSYHNNYGHIPTINISRPGINKNMNKALIYYDTKSGKLSGSGFYLILEKANNSWVIKEKIIAWRS
jgi:hypothetical protein